MDAYQKDSTAQWYDRLSGIYDRLAESSERPARLLGLQLLNPQPQEVCLEVGFGTGHALLSLAHAVGPRGRVCGIDISDKMRKQAQARIDREMLPGKIELKTADARKLPYDDARFDAAFLSFTLELFDDTDRKLVLSELRRVLQPGGRLAVISLSKEKRATVGSRLYEQLHRWFPSYLDCHPIDAEGAVKEAGFQTVKSQRFSLWGITGIALVAKK